MRKVYTAALLLLCSWEVSAQVLVTGAMRNTMFNGQLAGLVRMDTIAKQGAFGIGPLDHLRGELLLWDGVAYVSRATSDTALAVEVDREASAPFFVHANVPEWVEVPLPDSITGLAKLDGFLTSRFAHESRPMAFKLSGWIARAEIHVVDLPLGAVVRSPDDAHKGRKTFVRKDVEADMLGFFSTMHKAVFTHHDTNIHVHLVNKERSWMGHVDGLGFDPKAIRLFVQVQ
ncbi:MAG: acetolactate decarboxylase [Flavobacteriales bacterium]|jgi:acetolactate decarboxylase|nr:acetolactate decarboxylase [Flavobacteriales bacterium]MBK6753963.1 acetolactate decarboxylase [Flavobacteriales bacterium]MBK7270829.1 acetolactate decarboxylase [Flavobacteriales bacterium]MBK7751770.1 acetolactate decarboxylase [Flavobacteriales bacterium]MBK9076507.1 acetolactate decarboxylase [Flavobacteriales bacterium]